MICNTGLGSIRTIPLVVKRNSNTSLQKDAINGELEQFSTIGCNIYAVEAYTSYDFLVNTNLKTKLLYFF